MGTQIRHLDGSSLNNSPSNISIGTPSENMLDRLPEDRLNHAIIASTNVRKFTDEEINMIKRDHSITKSYKDTMAIWGISSKGTLHYILNNKYVTKKK